MRKEIIHRINQLGKKGKPFLFVIDYQGDILHTNKGDILQTSSEISGRLPDDYMNHLGDILAAQLPAGSITGAPKDKTMQIIHKAEGYGRGFYTGIMGICQNGELNSAVMIRFIEQEAYGMYFKAGGGITSKSDCRKEFQEMLQKIYLPIGEFSGVKELRQHPYWIKGRTIKH